MQYRAETCFKLGAGTKVKLTQLNAVGSENAACSLLARALDIGRFHVKFSKEISAAGAEKFTTEFNKGSKRNARFTHS